MPEHIDGFMAQALNHAADLGIGFTEVRFGEYRRQFLMARDRVLAVSIDETSAGFSVRVFHNGYWGFAAGRLTNGTDMLYLVEKAKAVAEAGVHVAPANLSLTSLDAYTEQWRSPVKRDPFDVPLAEKTDLLFSINDAMKDVQGVQETRSHMRFDRIHKRYMNSIGSDLDQVIVRTDADYTASAVGNGRFESRDYQSIQQASGYECIDGDAMVAAAGRVAREAVEQLTAAPWDGDTADLILLPNHTRLVIHETIGHATELDRVLGWEADYAGTSFATPEKRGNYRYGSPLFNVTADRTRPGGLASWAYDDEGVPAQSWKLIRDGILVDYATTRDTAPLIGESRSHGCAYADSWRSFPILRMANVGIDPGPDDAPGLEELIAGTENGILVDGMAAFSIDHQRLNFQFSGDYCRRIRNGRIEEPLWNVVYEGSNPSFWSAMDAVCNASEWKPYGVYGCAKGQPVQIAALTHGSAPLRLRNVQIKRSE
ncbi:MAG TPA: TldD/PmbA family protein [bacterium]|nr:TldD/PmbA family protein [bacterium]